MLQTSKKYPVCVSLLKGLDAVSIVQPLINTKPGLNKMNEKKRKIGQVTHGLSRIPLYRIWAVMKNRCYNSNDSVYKYYGGRGISVYNKWIKDFKKYYDYVTQLKNYEKYPSLDRIDNNGNYEPGNMRWTSHHIQSTNRELQNNNKSGFRGVHKVSKNRWQAGIQINGKLIYLGLFDTPEKANMKRINYIIENKLFEYKWTS